MKAKHLATQEERKIRSLVAVLVDFQVKKMELKMKQLDELELMLEKQRETIENQRRQVKLYLWVSEIRNAKLKFLEKNLKKPSYRTQKI